MKTMIAWLAPVSHWQRPQRLPKQRAPFRSIRSGPAAAERLDLRAGLRIATDKYDHLSRTGRLAHAAASTPPVEPPELCCVAAPPVLVSSVRQSDQAVPARAAMAGGEHGIFVTTAISSGRRQREKDGQLLRFTMDGKFVLRSASRTGRLQFNRAAGVTADVAVDVAAKEVFAADGYIAAWRCSTARPAPTSATGAPTATSRAMRKTPAYDPAKSPSQQFGNPCITSASTGRLVYVATAPTIACRSSARTAPSLPSISTRRRRAAPARLHDLVFSPDKNEIHLHDRR